MNSPADPLVKSRLPAAGAAGGAEWVLFTDWCAVTGHDSLPATAETVLMFFGDCPAAAGTFARRLTAIDAAHRAAGVPLPERTGQVRDVLRGRPARPVRQELPADLVNAALRRLPSHGWINGWFGRRDRALLVVAGAGVPYRRIAALTAGDVVLIGGVATINTAIGLVTLQPNVDPMLCGPCALVRWLRALHLALTSPATRTLAGAIDRTPAVDGASPHLCRSRRPIAQGIGDVPLLPPIDPRGHLAIDPRPLTPHSLSHLARGNTTSQGAVHRVDPQSPDEPQPPPAPPVAPPPTPYTASDWEQAVARRRADQNHLRGVDRALDETDRKAADLNRRILALLADT